MFTALSEAHRSRRAQSGPLPGLGVTRPPSGPGRVTVVSTGEAAVEVEGTPSRLRPVSVLLRVHGTEDEEGLLDVN